MYLRGGYNVYPLEVEHVLAEQPAVADVASTPQPVADELRALPRTTSSHRGMRAGAPLRG
jgi:acyl-CoA synthetase (AMP-forming)/AMP-acid ligase II